MSAGLGEPVYDKLDGDITRALMTINAVKGVEIGAGFSAASLSGEQNDDEMRMRDGRIVYSLIPSTEKGCPAECVGS